MDRGAHWEQCLAYLTEFGNEEHNTQRATVTHPPNGQDAFPLAAYALYEWNYHSKAAAPDETVDLAALKFMRSSKAYYSCFRRFGKVFSKTRNLESVLDEACTLGFTGVVQLILDAIPTKTPAMNAFRHMELELFLRGDRNAAARNSTTNRADNGELLVSSLRSDGAVLDSFIIRRCLRAAARHGHQDIIELLVPHHSCDLLRGSAYSSVLDVAALTGQVDLIKWLQDKNVITHADSREALSSAARGGQIETLKMLLSMREDIDANERMGSALKEAVAARRMAVVRFLLDNGANVNVKKGMIR